MSKVSGVFVRLQLLLLWGTLLGGRASSADTCWYNLEPTVVFALVEEEENTPVTCTLSLSETTEHEGSIHYSLSENTEREGSIHYSLSENTEHEGSIHYSLSETTEHEGSIHYSHSETTEQ